MYKRILLKVSGEALSSEGKLLDRDMLGQLCEEIKKIHDAGVEIAIVCGAGNIIRGKFSKELGLDRVQVDNMGMLATVINGLGLQNRLESLGIQTRVMSAIKMDEVCEGYITRRAVHHLEKGRIIICVAGTGHPFFSTDTAAALRASEVGAEVILMAKNGVDGVYNDDPRKNKEAKKYKKLNYTDVLSHDLQVMDQTAVTICKENKIDIFVFNMNDVSNISKAVNEEDIGTIINEEETCYE